MYNFPNNPSVGQTTPDGNWIWDGEKWNPTSTLPQQLAPRENILINGGFDVWQRGTTQSGNGYGSADRWNQRLVGAVTYTASRVTTSLGAAVSGYYVMNLNVDGSGGGAADYHRMEQRIEDVRSIANNEVITVSFRAYAVGGADLDIAVGINQVFGTGGSPTVTTYGGTVTVDSASWATYTVTITVPSKSGLTDNPDDSHVDLLLWTSAGANFNSVTGSLGHQTGQIRITDIKLEKGSTATDWVYEDIGTTLAKCQRYFVKESPSLVGYAQSDSGSSISRRISYFLPVTMRTTPTVTVTLSTGTLGTVVPYPRSIDIPGTASNSGTTIVTSGITADAEL